MPAGLLIKVIAEDRPDDLREAYEEAIASGPKWRERIDERLKRAPALAKIFKSINA